MKIRLLILLCLLAITTKAQTYHWAKSLGGTADDRGLSVTVDAAGNVYTTGSFKGTADLNPNAGVDNHTAAGSNADIFVQKMDAAGNFLWARAVGGTSDDQGYGIISDASGNTYTTGWFAGTVDFDPGPGITNITSVGGYNSFVLKLDASGNFLWARAFGGTEGLSVAADAAGNVYTTGDFGLTTDFDPGPGVANLTGAGGYDVFVQKMDASGNFLWARGLGGSGNDFGQAIVADPAGNVYVSGNFTGTGDFDPGPGVANLTSAGNDDVFIQKMDPSGNFLWAKSLGAANIDNSRSIALDADNNVFTTGFFAGTVDFDTGTGTTNITSAGGRDVFVHKMDAAGNFLWAKTFGGVSEEQAYGITTDALGNVYTSGFFLGNPDFDPGPGVANVSWVASFDVFIQKMDASGNFQWAKSFGGTNSEIGYDVAVDAVGNVYTTGHFGGTADFDPGTGTANIVSTGGSNIFVQKLRQCSPTFGTDTVASCGPYTWINGVTYTVSNNTATYVLNGANGCDSTVTLKLTINANTGTDVISSCGPYTWIDGVTYATSNNTATHVLTNTAGCDSTVTLNLTILSNTGTAVISACDSYTWIDGNTYVASNTTATHTLTNAAGCDSVVTLHLTINAPTSGTAFVTACDSYTWIDGNTYTTSNNTATHVLPNAAGCDSIVTLNLIVNHSNTGVDIITACDTYTWIDGNTYAASNNTATHTLMNAQGCDSVVTLNLTIKHSSASVDEVTACDSYTWMDGNTYTTSNTTATYVLQNAVGCDSVITLNLTVNHSTAGTAVIAACDSYTWIDGVTYTASNTTATHVLTNAVGCDSIVTLNLTIHHPNTGTDVISACGSYTWIDEVTYTASNNTATYTLQNAAGCDSVVTLNLTILSVTDLTTTVNGIQITANNTNATYRWLDCDNNYVVISGATNQTFTPTANGNYAVELTENGCVDTSDCVTISTVGISEYGFGNEMQLFPNPTDGNFLIDLGTTVDRAEISITDLSGKVLYTTAISQTQVVNLSLDQSTGCYFVTVRSGEKKTVLKLIKN